MPPRVTRSAIVGRRLLLAAALTFLVGIQLPARQNSAQGQDPEFARLVHEWTTKPEFLSPLVDHLPKVTGVPSPNDVLGYYVGAPKKLTYYADILKYYRALAAATPRVKVVTIGKTDEGRDCVVVFVGSDDSIRNLDQERTYLAQLADPRTITPAQATEIIAKAKPIYHVMAGLHSAETGPPEMLMELAYRLAVEDSPVINQIRDNVIVTLTPAAEPDGRDRYVDWYYRYLIDQTDEGGRGGGVPGPPYWGKYAFHDNNRDINYSQMSMKTLLDWYLQWHPPIMHELHESEPFMYTFSGQAPQNPTLDPILYGELPWFSNFEMAQMAKYGMPGVWTHAFVDMWSPGYLGFMASNHNGMMRMYEIFGNGGANTMHKRIAGGFGGPPTEAGTAGAPPAGETPAAPGGGGQGGGRRGGGAGAGQTAAGVPGTAPTGGRGGGGSMTSREWYRPFPPYAEVDWSMRNNTNYSETGVLTALQLTAAFPKVILENFYVKSRNSVEAGKKGPPYGYVIPANQRDMTRPATLVNILRVQGIEAGVATSAVVLKDGTFPAGSYIVKRDQPYGRLAKILLERQDYPDPTLQTYDNSAWTMGMMFNVDVKEIADKAILDVVVAPLDRAKIIGTMAGSATGAAAYAVMHNGSNNLITLRYRLKDVRMQAAEAPFKAGNVEYPAGSFIIPAQGDAGFRLKAAVEELGLVAAALPSVPAVATHDLNAPRVAMFSTWGSTQEVGWVRHAFDQFAVPYDLIYKERVKRGDLRGSYDVIVIPSQGRSGKGLVTDIASSGKPIAYTKTDKFQNLGMYGESDDITGGMGLEGVAEFRKFVENGGVLITMGGASAFPPEVGLTFSVDSSRTTPQFYAPGPIVQAEILNPNHPIFYGYTERTMPVRWAGGPLLQISGPDARDGVLMRFTGGDAGVLSGLMRNPNEIRNRPAVVDVGVGSGRVVMFATNPIYRWQNHGEFNMVFNAILNFDDFRPVKRPLPATSAGR